MGFVVLIILIEQSVALVPPKYLYPLGGDSFTYDVVNNQDGIIPKSTDCFTVGPSHPQLSFPAMYFDKNTNRFADVEIPSDNSIFDIGFTVFFNALDSSGFLFHYRSHDQGNINYITEMYVKLQSGKVESKIDSSSYAASPLRFPFGSKPPHPFSLKTWIMISFTNSYSGTTKLYVNALQEHYSHPFNYPLKTPGTLRFGADLNGALNPFHGFITCGALYNVVDGFDNVNDILQYCSEMNWPNTPPKPACQNWYKTLLVYHLYPLDDVALTSDVQLLLHNNNNKCLRSGETHPSFDHPGLRFDGSSFSSIKLKINSSDISGDFSLMNYVYFHNYSSGKIIQIISSTGQIVLTLIHSSIGVLFEAFNAGSSCAHEDIATNINYNTWILLGLLRNATQLLVSINGNTFSASGTCGSFGLSGFAYIEIGNSQGGSVAFRGSMRCLLMFNEFLNTDVESTVNHYCKMAQSNAVTDVANNCNVQNLNARKYYLFRDNSRPVNTIQQISFDIFHSLSACAVHCNTLVFCRSFTYSDGHCTMYEDVTDVGLISSPGSRYYILN